MADGMDLPKRKSIRLKDYDYTSNGPYFVTICTQNRRCILGEIVGVDALIDPYIQPLSQRIKSFKALVSKKIGLPIWQRSYHEHIVRNEQDYATIWNYIQTNPLKWELDKYHIR